MQNHQDQQFQRSGTQWSRMDIKKIAGGLSRWTASTMVSLLSILTFVMPLWLPSYSQTAKNDRKWWWRQCYHCHVVATLKTFQKHHKGFKKLGGISALRLNIDLGMGSKTSTTGNSIGKGNSWQLVSPSFRIDHLSPPQNRGLTCILRKWNWPFLVPPGPRSLLSLNSPGSVIPNNHRMLHLTW